MNGSPLLKQTSIHPSRPPRWVVLLFALALIYQFFHWIEHLAQVYQHWLLKLPAAASHGVLFFLDFEWNHFVFNTGYFIALAVTLGYFLLKRRTLAVRAGAIALLATGTLIQAYHQVEHTVKIAQHLALGCEPCPGILGKVLDGVYLHFTLNTIVLVLPLAAFLTTFASHFIHRRGSSVKMAT